MPDALHALKADFLQWVAAAPRSYAEAMELWRTTCPRLTVWEDSLLEQLIEVRGDGARAAATVSLTARGAALLQALTAAASAVPQRRVGIFIYPDVEVLDVAGPYEVFASVRLDESKRRSDPSPLRPMLIGQRRDPVVATGGMILVPHADFDSSPDLEILLVPGGWGSRELVDDPSVIEWVRNRAARSELTTSVCTGAFFLARAGILDGLRATTHWQSLDRLAQGHPRVRVERGVRVVREGNVFTSAGISAGIDMALQVVAHYHGEGVALATARHMEYAWEERQNPHARVAF